MVFILYDIQNYAVINMASLTLCFTRSVFGAGKHTRVLFYPARQFTWIGVV